ncbi:MAG: hypothetical protein E4G71_04570, partial [Candidatus Atribacteria bacterium]
MRKKKWFLWIMVILILGTGSFFGYNYWQSKSESDANSGNQNKPVDLASVIEVKLGNLKKTVPASGFL